MKSPTARLQSSDKKRSPSVSGSTSVLSVLGLLESLTLAIVLALVFRGFVVEAFVIPTGSMAETLLGIHAEIICPFTRSPGHPYPPFSRIVDKLLKNTQYAGQSSVFYSPNRLTFVHKP